MSVLGIGTDGWLGSLLEIVTEGLLGAKETVRKIVGGGLSFDKRRARQLREDEEVLCIIMSFMGSR